MPVALLIFEFVVLFLVLPLGFRLSPVELPALPLLWMVALYCFLVLRRDASFNRSRLWNRAALWPNLFSVMVPFAVLGSLIVLGVRLFAPHLLWQLVRQQPALWAVILVLYPVLSVYPQALIYRAFLTHRYTPLFPNPLVMILVSAVSFSFLHIIFRNSLAVWMTFLGGLIFTWRYQATGSLALSTLEHSLYGGLLSRRD